MYQVVLLLLITHHTIFQTYAFGYCNDVSSSYYDCDKQRREFLNILISSSAVITNPLIANSAERVQQTYSSIHDPKLRNYSNKALPNWQGTSLSRLSLSDAYELLTKASSKQSFNMARWPDPILRIPSSNVPLSIFQNEKQLEELYLVATALKNTAREEGAVGLAAQQCGIDASLIFIDNINNKKGTFLVNPRIINRSPESEMLVWTEECLVLPPQFRAILLRDAKVTIEYESLELESCGITKQITLNRELARCCQHEMDHDRGVLITDHVPLDELLSIEGNNVMASIEDCDGLHSERMKAAYSRYVSESSLLPSNQRMIALATEDRLGFHNRVHRMDDNMQPWFIEPVNAMEEGERDDTPVSLSPKEATIVPNSSSTISPECDSECLEERKRIIQERRQMMQQSRSNTRRADVLELSKQRASMYKADYKGLNPQACQGFCP